MFVSRLKQLLNKKRIAIKKGSNKQVFTEEQNEKPICVKLDKR